MKCSKVHNDSFSFLSFLYKDMRLLPLWLEAEARDMRIIREVLSERGVYPCKAVEAN